MRPVRFFTLCLLIVMLVFPMIVTAQDLDPELTITGQIRARNSAASEPLRSAGDSAPVTDGSRKTPHRRRGF